MQYVFSVYDKAVGSFDRPFVVRARGEALRIFNDACNDPQSPFNKHPGDFELFSLGTFNPSSGEIAQPVVERVVGALDMLQKM